MKGHPKSADLEPTVGYQSKWLAVPAMYERKFESGFDKSYRSLVTRVTGYRADETKSLDAELVIMSWPVFDHDRLLQPVQFLPPIPVVAAFFPDGQSFLVLAVKLDYTLKADMLE